MATLSNKTRGAQWSALLALSLLLPLVTQAQATTNSAGPEVWMGPPASDNGACLRALFAHPDQWQQTRALVDVLLYADHQLNRQFTDDELRAYFTTLQTWKTKLALEVGAVKEWGITGTNTFTKQRPMWDRFQRLGGNIYAIAMDEPLLCVRHSLKKTDDYAVQETASFIALVRQHYPQVLIGDIETYPSTPFADHLWWIDALQKRLAEMNVRGLDFYRLDVNWVEFNVFGRGSWPEVKKLEQECRKRKLPFSLIYWASDYPAMKKRGLADDSTWYVSILRQGYDYALVNGAPDQVVIESWVGAPSQGVPETGDFTFTRSVRDFVKKFVK
jgi:hypothetical protein